MNLMETAKLPSLHEIAEWINNNYWVATPVSLIVAFVAFLHGRRKTRKQKDRQIAGRIFNEDNIDDV